MLSYNVLYYLLCHLTLSTFYPHATQSNGSERCVNYCQLWMDNLHFGSTYVLRPASGAFSSHPNIACC